MTPRSTRRLENQLRMEIVKTGIDWDMVLETIPRPGHSEEEDAKRRFLIQLLQYLDTRGGHYFEDLAQNSVTKMTL